MPPGSNFDLFLRLRYETEAITNNIRHVTSRLEGGAYDQVRHLFLFWLKIPNIFVTSQFTVFEHRRYCVNAFERNNFRAASLHFTCSIPSTPFISFGISVIISSLTEI